MKTLRLYKANMDNYIYSYSYNANFNVHYKNIEHYKSLLLHNLHSLAINTQKVFFIIIITCKLKYKQLQLKLYACLSFTS